MKTRALSPLLMVALSAIQVLGPAALWAAEERGIRVDESRRMVITAVSGEQLTVQQRNGTKAIQFREPVNLGESVTTGDRTVADLLIGTRVVVTLGPGTTIQMVTVSDEQATIQVSYGLVRVAAAPSRRGSQGVVTVQTPTGQVQTRGGIVRVLVETPVGKAEPVPTGEAKSYLAAYAPERMAAAGSPQGELIQVDEGTAEISGAGGKTVTIQAGQSVTLQAGKAGAIGEGVKPEIIRPGVVATQGHNQTPKEGRDYLVALQVNQAAQLADTLTKPTKPDPKKSKPEESEKKSNAKDVINGATGGVTVQNNLISALFGGGSAANPAGSNPTNSTGAGYGGNNNNGFDIAAASGVSVKVNGGDSFLVFTRKDPVEAFVLESTIPLAEHFADPADGETTGKIVPYEAGKSCDGNCLATHRAANLSSNVGFRFLANEGLFVSNFTVTKELVLIGGDSNKGHGGIAPKEQLIVRGAELSNRGLYPTDRDPSAIGLFSPTPPQIVAMNSTFVVKTRSEFVGENVDMVGGTLGQFSDLSIPSPNGIALVNDGGSGISHIDGAITATTDPNDPTRRTITLKGGVSLDQKTTATIGTTTATDTYFKALTTDLGRTFSGSLLSVIRGPNSTPTSLTMQDRMLGVYDGSIIKTDGGNKALLSVLDAKLKGPGSSMPLIDIAAGTHFTLGAEVAPDGKRTVTETQGSPPNVTVTSALVTRSTIQLDGALLEASAPLIALTGLDKDRRANMTTTSHFADLAGNQAQSLNLNGALVALNASTLSINSGHLLNLNNATAAISGYLFSLTSGSSLDIKNGALFSLNDRSSLTLTGEAFGVFGSGSNTLTIENNLCTGPCGTLVNSTNQPITTLEGIPLKVSGVTQDVVLPNGFNAFALAPGATAPTAKIDIDANDALFHLDPTSTLIINGTQVK